MSKRKTVERLEAIIDSLKDSLETVKHNVAENDYVLDQIIRYQEEYKRLTGNWYRPKHL